MTLIHTMLRLSRRCAKAAVAGAAPRRLASAGQGPASAEPADTQEGSAGASPSAAPQWPCHVVSGLQPTGALHAGNYFGALRRCVRAQQDGLPLTLFVADLHALTTHTPGVDLAANTLQLAATALAAGVCPERSVLFVQSAVPRHAELCWLLACLCTQARLQHLPQYRERVGAASEGAVGVGALLYPVLQAADVLSQRATLVPAGADQLQHLQLAALLARTFHHRYGHAFPVPRPLLPEDGSDRIRSLRDPLRKMSKSDRDRKAAILLTDSDDDIRRKIRKAVTDFTPKVTFEPESRPGVSNLVRLHCLAADLLPEEVVEEYDHLTTAQYKTVVAEALVSAVRGVRARAVDLQRRPRYLRDVLALGAARARRTADETHAHVQRLVGLLPHAPPAHGDVTATHHAVRLPPATALHGDDVTAAAAPRPHRPPLSNSPAAARR